MDWGIISKILSWVIPAIIGGAVTWLIDRRPRLLSFLLTATAVTLPSQTPGAPPQRVHAHTVVLRNRGRRAATNLRVTHHTLPAFSIYPPMAHTVEKLPSGEDQIVFATFPPHFQIQINYLYFPPLLYSQIHAGITSDEGSPTTRDIQIAPRIPPWLIVLIWVLIVIGGATIAYFIYLFMLRVLA